MKTFKKICDKFFPIMLGHLVSKIFQNVVKWWIFWSVIYAGFFGWGGSRKCLGGPIFRRWNEILLLGKALKFGVIFQKYALKLIKKIEKNLRKFEKKCKFFRKFFNFRAGHKFLIVGKINNLIWACCNVGLGGGAHRRLKIFQVICRNR